MRELKADGLLPAETKLAVVEVLEQSDRAGPSGRGNSEIATMLGFKGFATAAITIAGIELMHRIRKGQPGLGRLGCPRPTCACSVECRAPSLKSLTVQHGTLSGMPAICTRAKMSRRAAGSSLRDQQIRGHQWLERLERQGSREPVGHGGHRASKLMPHRDFLEAARAEKWTSRFRLCAIACRPSAGSGADTLDDEPFLPQDRGDG